MNNEIDMLSTIYMQLYGLLHSLLDTDKRKFQKRKLIKSIKWLCTYKRISTLNHNRILTKYYFYYDSKYYLAKNILNSFES